MEDVGRDSMPSSLGCRRQEWCRAAAGAFSATGAIATRSGKGVERLERVAEVISSVKAGAEVFAGELRSVLAGPPSSIPGTENNAIGNAVETGGVEDNRKPTEKQPIEVVGMDVT